MSQSPPPEWQPPVPQGPPQPSRYQWVAVRPVGHASPPQGWGPPPASVRRRSKAPAVIAGGLVVALVVGALLAVSFFRGNTPAAAKGLPSNVLMALEVNLAPAPADQLALARIIAKLPLSGDSPQATDYKQALWDLLPDNTGDKPDYASEVKPWLGNSIAVGFLDSGPRNLVGDQVVVAVETTDQQKAGEFAAKHAAEGNEYFFVDDVLVITSTPMGLDAASIKESSLAEDGAYRADMAKLGRGSLASVWVGPAAFDTLLGQGPPGAYPAAEADLLRGAHGAIGVKVGDDRVTLSGHFLTPGYPQPGLGDVRGFAHDLPGGVLAAMAVSASSESYAQSWRYLEDAGLAPDLVSMGIASSADLEALLGHQVGVTIGRDGAGEPTVAALLVSPDPARQQELVAAVKQQLLPQGSPEEFAVEHHGGILYVAYGQSVGAVQDPTRRLGESDAYEDVVQDAASAVAFLDVDALEQLPIYEEMVRDPAAPDISAWVEPFRTIGMAATSDDDGYGSTRIEVTFN